MQLRMSAHHPRIPESKNRQTNSRGAHIYKFSFLEPFDLNILYYAKMVYVEFRKVIYIV